MKKPYLVIVIFLFAMLGSTAQETKWNDFSSKITSSSGTPDLSDVCFIGNEGWVTSGNLSELYYTADGGETFAARTVPDQTFFNSISMRTNTEGYAAAQNGNIYKSIDGGITWTVLGSNLAPAKSISYRSPVDGKWGIACGDNGTISGIWPGSAVHILPVGNNLRSADCPEGNGAWICGENNLFRFAGAQIHLDQVYPTGDYNAVYMVHNLTGWAAGANGMIIHTTDGLNWSEQVNPDVLHRAVNGLFFLTENEGWAVGTDGVILHTIDGGSTWAVEGTGLTSQVLNAVCFTSSTNGYAAGKNKTLLRFCPSTGIGTLSGENPFQVEISPNPVDLFVNISCRLATGNQASVVMELVTMDGANIMEGEFPAGSGKITLDVSQLPAGVYFIKITYYNFTVTKKLIKIN